MSRLSRLAAGAVVALALVTPAAAEQQPASSQPATPSVLTTPVTGPPTAAILRIEGGFSPHERWLWFDADGTARLRGMLFEGGRGRFKSHADFKSVRAVLDDANACAAAQPHSGASTPSIIARDRFFYRVDVRCGKTWYALPAVVKAGSDAPDFTKIVHGLEAIADTLTWEPTDENVALPNATPLFRFAAPTG